MLIGIPKEIKDHEYRMGANPSMVKTLVDMGHTVMVQENAGERIGFKNEMFLNAGARIVKSAAEIYNAEMVVKVKEPQESEFDLLKEGQILFCYLHLAPEPKLTKALIDKKVIAIAYETVVDQRGRLPLLIPMSEIAGRISIQVGASLLQMAYGGKGTLLGGVPGVAPGKVLVIGGGIVGTQAAKMALGLGADVVLLDNNQSRLRELDDLFGPRLKTVYSSTMNVEKHVQEADLVIGAVLIPGKLAPRIVTKEMVAKMEAGSVIVDVAIDQGGCIETARVTTHSNPTYVNNGVIHYCVANMPGACAKTSTLALTYATTSYVIKLANLGYKKALMQDCGFRLGLNVALSEVTNEAVAHDLGYKYVEPEKFLT
jgi:alanine dehydrogenase